LTLPLRNLLKNEKLQSETRYVRFEEVVAFVEKLEEDDAGKAGSSKKDAE
jgi:hypothetical protein